MTSWQHVPVAECDEPLIPMGPFSDYPQLAGHAVYFGERTDSPYPTCGPGTLITHFARHGVVSRLALVADRLPRNHILWLWDTYRTEETQRTLYEWFEREVVAQLGLAGDELAAHVERYVSLPSTDSQKPSPHLTGGAIDLTIAVLPEATAAHRAQILEELHDFRAERQVSARDRSTDVDRRAAMLHLQLADLHRCFATPLDMGTAFDEMNELASADYFAVDRPEVVNATEIQANRKLLRDAMESGGFTQYADEWWHFDFGNQMWAEASAAPHAIYGPSALDDQLRAFEDFRRRAATRNTA